MPKISIVIPAYRAEKTIARTIDSVIAQPDVRCEIIVVVDGVYDRTAEIASSCHPDVKVLINEQNRGSQASRNRGLNAVTSNYIMFLDADDFIEGRLLAGLARALAENGADVAFGPWVEELDDGGRGTVRASSNTGRLKVVAEWLEKTRVPTCAVLWRTKSIREFGGWNERIDKNQDGEMVLRALTKGAKVAVSNEGVGVYWQHDSPYRITGTSLDIFVRSQMEIGQQVRTWLQEEGGLEEAVTPSLALFYYMNARGAYRCGENELGDTCLRSARQLGMSGHGKLSLHALGAAILGLKRKEQLSRLKERWGVDVRGLTVDWNRSK